MNIGRKEMQQIEKKYKCYECLGCNRLENENFKGTYRCPNFVSGIGEKKDDNNRM